MTQPFPDVLTVAVITFNAEPYLRDCLDSLLGAGVAEKNILVVDDGSTDSTSRIMETEFPGIRFLPGEGNRGHSYSCNRAIDEAVTPWLVLVDHDTEVHPDWYRVLIQAMDQQPDAAIFVARTIFDEDRETIHCDGGFAHFLGNMSLLNGFAPRQGAPGEMIEIGAAGTTSMVVNREWALRVGGFDDDFFIYLNDFEFSLRVRLAGGRLYSVPMAVIYHKGGTPDVSFRGTAAYPARRAYLILRNRWFLIFKLYRLKTLLLISPALVLYEVCILGMVTRRGVWHAYRRAWEWLFQNRSLVRAHRQQAQLIRQLDDTDLLSAGPLTFVPGVLRGRLALFGKGLLDNVFSLYWRFIVRFL